MKKKRKLIIGSIVTVFIIFISIRMCASSLEYKIMSNTEALKNQIQEEYQAQSKQIFESVSVEREWWSLSQEDWTFIVSFSSNPTESVYYKLIDGKFVKTKDGK